MPDSSIKIIIADNLYLVRRGLWAVLKDEPNIEIIGEAENGSQLVQLTNELQPEAILTDIHMPVMNGFEATRQLVAKHEHLYVIAISEDEQPKIIEEIINAGAKAYLAKSAPPHEIIEAIQTVTTGETFYCKHTQQKMEAYAKEKKLHNGYDKPKLLTKQEEAIIIYACRGFNNEQIAAAMYLSKRTIEDYKGRIYVKTNTKNTAGIMLYAIAHGLWPSSLLLPSLFNAIILVADWFNDYFDCLDAFAA